MAWKKTELLGNWGIIGKEFVFPCVIVATMEMCCSDLLVQEARSNGHTDDFFFHLIIDGGIIDWKNP